MRIETVNLLFNGTVQCNNANKLLPFSYTSKCRMEGKANQRRVPHELVGRLLIVMIACSSNIMNSRELHVQLTLDLSLPAKILMSHDESFC